jgi:hypothetical protein
MCHTPSNLRLPAARGTGCPRRHAGRTVLPEVPVCPARRGEVQEDIIHHDIVDHIAVHAGVTGMSVLWIGNEVIYGQETLVWKYLALETGCGHSGAGRFWRLFIGFQ